MQNSESEAIVRRFFEALALLKRARIIRGEQTFTRRYGINRRNLYLLKKEPSRDIFQVSWLARLVEDYGVSSEWLLLGSGEPGVSPDSYPKTAKRLHEKMEQM